MSFCTASLLSSTTSKESFSVSAVHHYIRFMRLGCSVDMGPPYFSFLKPVRIHMMVNEDALRSYSFGACTLIVLLDLVPRKVFGSIVTSLHRYMSSGCDHDYDAPNFSRWTNITISHAEHLPTLAFTFCLHLPLLLFLNRPHYEVPPHHRPKPPSCTDRHAASMPVQRGG